MWLLVFGSKGALKSCDSLQSSHLFDSEAESEQAIGIRAGGQSDSLDE